MAKEISTAKRFKLTADEWRQENPGLYAFWPGDDEARHLLGLKADDDHPLYVGLARNTLRSRIEQYVDSGFSGSREFRWGLLRVLNVVSNTWVPEGLILMEPDKNLAEFKKLPFSLAAVPQWHSWMTEHLLVSTVYVASALSASKLEGGVIDLLEPLINISGNARFRNDPAADQRFAAGTRARIEAHNRFLEAMGHTMEVMQPIDTDQSVDRGQPIRVEFEDFELPPLLVPTDPVKVRTEARDALSTWLGAPYPEDDLDSLMSILGTWSWLPGTKAAVMKHCGLTVEALVRLN